jgi:hypothetical protein
MQIPFIGPAYNGRSIALDSQECVNLYPEAAMGDSKNVIALVGCPGLESFATITGNGGGRCLYTTSTGRLFAVCGNQLSELSTDGTETVRGNLLTSVGMVHMADNGISIGIVDGTYYYHYNLSTSTLTRLTAFSDASSFTINPSHIVFIAGYLVINERSSGKFWFSASYDATSWDALDFYTAEGSPDTLKAIAKTNNELWLLSEQSSEVWYYTGNSDDDFNRISGAINDYGTASANSVATNSNTIFWLGSSNKGKGSIWMANGYQPERISTHAIEYQIGQMARIDDAVGYCYQEEGHFFYVLTFQTGGKTFCFDMTTGLWHERGHWNSETNNFQQFKGLVCCNFNETNYVGDYGNSSIYKMSLDIYDYNGDALRRVRTTPHVHNDRKTLYFGCFEVDMESGVGLTTGQGVDPQAMLQWSDDGGYTWSNEHWRDIGAKGKYGTRVKWNRLGSSRDRVFRFVVSDPVKCVLINAHADIAVGE